MKSLVIPARRLWQCREFCGELVAGIRQITANIRCGNLRLAPRKAKPAALRRHPESNLRTLRSSEIDPLRRLGEICRYGLRNIHELLRDNCHIRVSRALSRIRSGVRKADSRRRQCDLWVIFCLESSVEFITRSQSALGDNPFPHNSATQIVREISQR